VYPAMACSLPSVPENGGVAVRFPDRAEPVHPQSAEDWERPTLDPVTDAVHALGAVLSSAASSTVIRPFASLERIKIMEERHRYRSIILFGMPGSGKGTQGAVLGQLPDLVHISMGDVFRKIPRNGKFGREIEQYTSQGGLVPDDLTVRIFERHL